MKKQTKKKLGRPAIAKSVRRKGHRIGLLLTADELAAVKAAAGSEPPGRWARRVVVEAAKQARAKAETDSN